jgi:predicted metalloprotease with PDZ domain
LLINWVLCINLKSNGIPLIALNLEKEITGKVARTGIHSLTAEEKQRLPSQIDLSNEQYREVLYQVFLIHQKHQGHQHFEYFLQTQALWDETMAQTAHEFLVQHPDTRLIVLAGNGHVMYKYGIPNRVYRRNGEPFTVIVQDESLNEGIGDYVLFSEEIQGKQSPKLGVGIKDKPVVIMSVADNTPAKKAGLQVGDIITKLADWKIETLVDLKWVLFYTEMGDTVKIEVLRDGKTMTLDITLFKFGHH